MNVQKITAKLDAYERLMRLDKPIGILLLLWPTLWALLSAARGRPDWIIVMIFFTEFVETLKYNFQKKIRWREQRTLSGPNIPFSFACLLGKFSCQI